MLATLIQRVRSFSTWQTRVCIARAAYVAQELSGSDLDHVDLWRCALDRANLERSTWRGSFVFECSLVGTTLGDSVFDGAMFVDCDLRGADLSAPKLGSRATMRGLRLERCDLRATNWRSRDLERVTFVGCKMYGMFGAASTLGAIIVDPDTTPGSEDS